MLSIYSPSDLRRLIKRIPRYYPGWWSTGGGGGLASVSIDGTLTGNGKVATPLGIPPVTGFTAGTAQANSLAATANFLTLGAFFVPGPLTFAHIALFIAVADGVNNSDFGVYNSAGTLVANLGPQTFGSTGLQGFATVQGSKTIPSGLYFFGFTSLASTIKNYFTDSTLNLLHNSHAIATVAGTCPASIAPPALAPTQGIMNFMLY